jgi:hypothetical protein
LGLLGSFGSFSLTRGTFILYDALYSMTMDLSKKSWWEFADEGIRELLAESLLLVENASPEPTRFHDYSFIVFPAAKAYEGFLKKVFLKLGFITQEDYAGKRFRIGKALNPSLERDFRNESVYDRISDYCGGRELADLLWETWKNCRNMVFHWFPNEANTISYEEAVGRVDDIIDAFDKVFTGCNINYGSQSK